jgi:hypothetical protein
MFAEMHGGFWLQELQYAINKNLLHHYFSTPTSPGVRGWGSLVLKGTDMMAAGGGGEL